MWARILECTLGCWLALSPWIFHEMERRNALTFGALLALFSLLSFYRPLEKIYLCNLPIGIWLVALGCFFELPLPGYVQNESIIGMLLVILAIVPCRRDLVNIPETL